MTQYHTCCGALRNVGHALDCSAHGANTREERDAHPLDVDGRERADWERHSTTPPPMEAAQASSVYVPREIPPPGPRVDPKEGAADFRRGLPKAVHRASVLDVTEDAMAIIQRELARFKALKALSFEQIRSVEALAKTAASVRTLEKLIEDEVGEELGKLSDDELKERAGR